MPPNPAAAAVASFGRRVWWGAFVGELAVCVTAAAIAAATALIAVRLAGGHLAPHPAWAAALLPIVGVAWWRARSQRLPPGVAAAWLDRRLSANGLLLCAHDGAADPAWAVELARPLQGLPAALPRIRWRRLLPTPALAVVVAAIVAVLPPPPAPPMPQGTAVGRELERTAEAMRDLLARGAVPEDTKRELEDKLRELQQRLAAGDVPDWRDVDQLEQRLERERLLQDLADPQAGRPADGARSGEAGALAAGASITPEQLADLANALAAAAPGGELPEGLRAMLAEMRGEHGIDAGALAKDREALQKLAAAMAAAGADLAQLDVRGKLSEKQLADLQAIVDDFGGAGMGGGGEGTGEGEGGEGDGVGRGGVDRGPGHAALAMTEDAQGEAAAAMPLPPGLATPSEWVPIGSRPAEPEVNPQQNAAAGGAAAVGTGGASWQLQLAPRHRSVVQRYFGTPAPPAGTRERR